jgi:hypothetical protein
MSTLLANRVQSAYSRPPYRSGTDGQDAHLRQRPTTSVGTRQSFANVSDQAAMKTFESSALSSRAPSSRYRRAKTASISTTASARPGSRKLRSDEIESLVQSLQRNDTYIVQIDSLAEYQTLVQTIDLRRTPIDCQLLCALQQRENRIVQGNACRDIRFRSLMETLEPFNISADNGKNDSNDADRSMSEYPYPYPYPPSDLPYQYIK